MEQNTRKFVIPNKNNIYTDDRLRTFIKEFINDKIINVVDSIFLSKGITIQSINVGEKTLDVIFNCDDKIKFNGMISELNKVKHIINFKPSTYKYTNTVNKDTTQEFSYQPTLSHTVNQDLLKIEIQKLDLINLIRNEIETTWTFKELFLVLLISFLLTISYMLYSHWKDYSNPTENLRAIFYFLVGT